MIRFRGIGSADEFVEIEQPILPIASALFVRSRCSVGILDSADGWEIAASQTGWWAECMDRLFVVFSDRFAFGLCLRASCDHLSETCSTTRLALRTAASVFG